ncbi:MAG: EscN/YscN/HrcN family type III secretion system ATPase [Phycisphaeraceae bacterium]|nr:EscN/YscN/HrcN family type III secretion system ATPase [Phycisphaeraceae bacterium]
MTRIAEQLDILEQTPLIEMQGQVLEVRGLACRVGGISVPVGAMVRIETRDPLLGEVVGFDKDEVLVMPFGATGGIKRGDIVTLIQLAQTVPVGDNMLGRVVNALGQPIDEKGPINGVGPRSLYPKVVDPMDRPLIDEPLGTGVRVVDAMTTLGCGQRIGVFAPPGVGKSTILGMMARGTSADVIVVGLVGERGREVQDFVQKQLGKEGLKRAVVVVATGDESPLLRIRAAQAATTVAEFFRDQGKNVLLIMDSLTRFCQAQRQVGLATGEPPATKGFTPSVFSMLPILLERSGRTSKGAITGLYAVLVEGDVDDDPISEAARGVLDGHILLSRALSHRNYWPAVDVLGSISRVADDVINAQHSTAAAQVRRLLAAYKDVEDLLNIGAYADGSNEEFDLAIACKPAIDQLLMQGRSEMPPKGKMDVFTHTSKQLVALSHIIEQNKTKLAQQSQRMRQAQMQRRR